MWTRARLLRSRRTILRAWDHALGDDASRCAAPLARRHARDARGGVVHVAQDGRHVGDQEEGARVELDGDLVRDGVGVDVVRVALGVGAEAGEHGHAAAASEQREERRVDAHDVADEPEIDRLGARARHRPSAGALGGEGRSPLARGGRRASRPTAYEAQQRSTLTLPATTIFTRRASSASVTRWPATIRGDAEALLQSASAAPRRGRRRRRARPCISAMSSARAS